MEVHNFILKSDGCIYWIDAMPDSSDYVDTDDNVTGSFDEKGYQQALQSAIDSAVEVSNQKEVEQHLYKLFWMEGSGIGKRELGKLYSLQCRVEKKINYIPIGRGLHYKIEGEDKLRQADLVSGGIGYMAKVTAHVTFDSPSKGEEVGDVSRSLEEDDALWYEVIKEARENYMNPTQRLKNKFSLTRKPLTP